MLDIATAYTSGEEKNSCVVNLKQGYAFLNQVNMMLPKEDSREKYILQNKQENSE